MTISSVDHFFSVMVFYFSKIKINTFQILDFAEGWFVSFCLLTESICFGAQCTWYHPLKHKNKL